MQRRVRCRLATSKRIIHSRPRCEIIQLLLGLFVSCVNRSYFLNPLPRPSFSLYPHAVSYFFCLVCRFVVSRSTHNAFKRRDFNESSRWRGEGTGRRKATTKQGFRMETLPILEAISQPRRAIIPPSGVRDPFYHRSPRDSCRDSTPQGYNF